MIGLGVLWLEVAAYVLLGMATGAVVLYTQRQELQDSYDRVPIQIGAVAAVPAWPLYWAFGVAAVLCLVLYKLLMGVAVRIGRMQHRAHIQASETAMREEDLERVGGSLELALRYEYRACQRCWGSGCAECKGRGVLRVNVGGPNGY